MKAKTTPKFFNRTQLARELGVSPETIRTKIAMKVLRPDAQDGRGADLFSEKAVAEYNCTK